MELRHVRYFLAVAEELNFTRAAERLGIAQPPLSQQIKALETELAAPLFRRLPHGVDLTVAGLAFLEEARALLRQAEHARQSVALVAGGFVGRLRVGMTGSAAFHPIVIESMRRFHERFPNIEFALQQHDTDMLCGLIDDGGLDVAFVRSNPGTRTSENVLRFTGEATVAALPAHHRLAESRSLELSMLTGERLLLFPRRAGPTFYDEIIAACHRANFEPQRILEVPQITSMPSFVAAGLGVALVPQSLSAMALPGLTYVSIVGEVPVAPLALWSGATSPVTANFVSIATETGRPEAVRFS
jgi:DNA-binding transcriptional LysR family regulator